MSTPEISLEPMTDEEFALWLPPRVRDLVAASGASVGVVWIHPRRRANKPEAYIYDLFIYAHQCGTGYRRDVMMSLSLG